MNEKKTEKIAVNFRIQTVYLLVLLPVLGIVTVVMSAIIHNHLYHDIDRGYDRKLAAISMATGAFIDADENEELLRTRTILGLTYVDSRSTFYGIDCETDWLVTISERHGGPEPVGDTGMPGIVDLAYDSCNDVLYGVDESGHLAALNLDTGEATFTAFVDRLCTGLAFRPQTEELFISGRNLIRMNPAAEAMHVVSASECERIGGMVYSRERDRLLAIGSESNTLLAIDPQTGQTVPIGSLTYTWKEAAQVEGSTSNDGNSKAEAIELKMNQIAEFDRIRHIADPKEIAELRTLIEEISEYTITEMNAGDDEEVDEEVDEEEPENPDTEQPFFSGLAWNPYTSSLYTAARRLVKIDPSTAACQEVGWWDGFRTEIDDTYLDYILPMRRIWNKLNLTYLSTFRRPTGGTTDDEIYILDVDYNNEHVRIGYLEEFIDGEGIRVYGKVNMGGVYTSRVVDWGEWGLLKTGYAPIYNWNGEIKAVLGSDINVSIISTKTRIALLKTIGIGLLAFLIAVLVVYGITIVILKPILHLMEKTLVVAAGRYGEKVSLHGPTELRKLGSAFNKLSQAIKDYFEQRTNADRIMEEKSRRLKLMRILERECDEAMDWDVQLCAGKTIGYAGNSTDVSGCIEYLHFTLAWSGIHEGDPLEAAKEKRIVVLVADKLLKRYGDNWKRMASCLRPLFPDTISRFILMDNESGVTNAIVRQPTIGMVCDSQQVVRQILVENAPFTIQPGQSLIVSSAGAERITVNERRLCDSVSSGAKAILEQFEVDLRETIDSSELYQTQLMVITIPEY